MNRRIACLAICLGAAFPVSTASAASLWTPVTSGTTQAINAIAIPAAGEMVYVTSGGQIAYLSAPGTFTQATVTPAAPLGFTDVAMSPDGTKGVAVGPHGAIYDSTDSGHTWAKLAAQPNEFTGACPTPGAPIAPLSDNLLSVAYADNSTVFVTGNNDDVLKSTNAGSTFTEVNKTALKCVADPGGSTQAFSDSVWLTATTGYLLSNDFGEYWTSTDGFTGTAGGTVQGPVGSVNGFQSVDRLAIDRSDPTHAWAIGGGATNGSYFQYTTNSGTNWNTPTYDDNQVGLTDIDASGTTVVAVGTGGDIYTSPNGATFYRQVAAAPNTTNNWNAVAFVPGTNQAYVGGAGGVLVATANAAQVPDTTAPTGTITGPTSLTVGQFGSYTANVTDNPGGSGVDTNSFSWSVDSQTTTGPTATFAFNTVGVHTITLTFKDLAGNVGTATLSVNVTSPAPTPTPTTPPSGTGLSSTTTGGATVGLYGKVTITGRKGRYIPVQLSCKHPRRFVIKLVGAGKKTVSTFKLSVQKGHVTAHVPVPASAKTGTYSLIVRIYTTGKHSKQVGKTVTKVFVLS